MLNWAKQFNIFCFLDNRQYTVAPHQYECLLAAGAAQHFQNPFASLKDVDAQIAKGDWLFGHLSYELKNSDNGIGIKEPDKIGFPLFSFFIPAILIYIQDNVLYIQATNADEVYAQIMAAPVTAKGILNISLQQRFTKEEYIKRIEKLQEHIRRGDCYEINFCQEFFAEDVSIDPVSVFEQLVQVSPNPFSALYRLNDSYLICASPERFLYKRENKILSQPIKGTAKRGDTVIADEQLKAKLKNSQKERSENVMVVDLVRNDLSKICEQGSVQVDELFGIYSYPNVHQMISTISGQLKENVSFSAIIDATFPMGSMTGAPKHRVMQLIDEYETVPRGVFSGSVGYIKPNGDFDFNVVIRSIMYNAATKYLSYQTGSGITFYSNAALEWEECLLKGAAIKKVLTTWPAL